MKRYDKLMLYVNHLALNHWEQINYIILYNLVISQYNLVTVIAVVCVCDGKLALIWLATK